MENLGIDLKLIIAQAVNFALFFIIFQRFIAKPFLKYVKEQRKKEDEKNKLLQELNVQTEQAQSREKEFAREQKKQIDKVILQAKKDAEVIRDEIISKANHDAEAILAKSKEQLEEERQAIYKDMKSQIAHLSTVVVTKALGSYLNEDAQKKVTENILNNLPKDLNA